MIRFETPLKFWSLDLASPIKRLLTAFLTQILPSVSRLGRLNEKALTLTRNPGDLGKLVFMVLMCVCGCERMTPGPQLEGEKRSEV